MIRYFYSSLAAKLFATSCAVVTGIVSLKLFDIYLTPAEFGIVAVALQILAYLPLIDGGVRTAANHRLLTTSSEIEKSRLFAFCQTFYSWFGIVVVLVTALAMGAYWLTPNIQTSGQPYSFFLALGLTLALSCLAASQGAMLIALGYQQYCFWVAGFASLINLGALAAGLNLGFRIWAFPFANAVGLLVIWPIYILAVRSKLPGFKILDFRISAEFKEELKKIGAQAFHSFRTQLAIVLLFSLDLVIVGMIYPPREAAIYALLTRVFGIFRSFIQSAGEVSWPLWVQNSGGGKDWSFLLLKANAWLYGSIVGALAFSLLPFLRWFMGPEWTASWELFVIMLVRFCITGISNPAGYFLIGRGQFRSLARVLEMEVVAAIILALALRSYGPSGVAAGFAIATIFGTFLPILFYYAKAAEHPGFLIVRSLWLRAAAAFAGSVVVTAMLVRMSSSQLAIVGGAVGTCTGLAIALLFAYFHWRSSNGTSTPGFSLRAVVSKI